MDETKSTGERLLTGYYDRFTVEHLHRYAIAVQLAENKTVLDIASGEGYGSNLLSHSASQVFGVDIDSNVVSHAQGKYRRGNLRFLQGSADQIPLPANSVDLVVSFETLEHHDQHEAMYAEVKRVLRTDGLLIISTPDKLHFSDLTGHRNAFHVKELYLSEFEHLNRTNFNFCKIYSQKAVLGSLIIPNDAESLFTLFEGSHGQTTARQSFPTPTYHICIASDSPIPNLGASFFDGRDLLDKMESELYSKGEQIESLQKRIENQSIVETNLLNSLSYRLGNFILKPFKTVLRR